VSASPREALLAALAPVLEQVKHLDLTDPVSARDSLAGTLPLAGAVVQDIRTRVLEGLADGWLCPHENGAVRYGRVAKAGRDHPHFGVDAVLMHTPGPGHTHPEGEVDLCFALDGAPTFDGNPPGWTVYGPGSWHVPTVAGGTMAILYFLPDGAIVFEERPA
jgi:hypothetical protein